jgi:hypothetical protein
MKQKKLVIMKRFYRWFIALILLTLPLFGQQRHLLPGESQQLRDQIQSEVFRVIGANHQLGMILNVDSCLGLGVNVKIPPIIEIGNPYGTLTNCIIFTTTRQGYPTQADSAEGVIGIFKQGTIVWHSGGSLALLGNMSSDWIWAVKDINRDGKVDILVDWLAGMSFPRLRNLWIVSWDGIEGQIINARDQDGLSIIQSSETWNFNLADVEGDGIWEIQGAHEPQNAADSLRKIPDTDYALYTYSWNGSLYGLWPNTPQPPFDAQYPLSKAFVDVKASVQQNGSTFEYSYRVHDLSTSLQYLQGIAIDKMVDTVVFTTTRPFWTGYISWLQVIEWWCDGIEGVNYIRSGEIEPTFSFLTVGASLPRILKFYSFGLNEGASDGRQESLDNSYQGLTLGPADPPLPFVTQAFLDSLISYTTESRSLDWIKDQTTANKYLGYFSSANSGLQQNNIASTRATLQQVLQDANVDSTANITSEAYALIRYNTEYLLGQLPTPISGCNVKLINSSGTRLIGGSLQYYEGSWKDAVNNNDGTFFVNTTATIISLRMTYEYGTETKSNVTVGPDTAVFQTVNAQIQLQDSRGSLIDTGTVQYYGGAWRSLGTTAGGIAQKELLPGNYSFRMTYAYASKDKQQDISTNPTVVFQTVSASVQLQNSQGGLIDQGTVQYYAGAWRDFGVTTNGAASKELLPNNYSFRMTYALASKDKQQDIGANPTVVFQTVNATVQLQNSQGALMPAPLGDQGTVQYYSGAWRDFGTTTNGIANKELLPNNYSFRMTYAYASKDKQQDIGANPTVVFQTVNATVQLQNSQGALMPAPSGDQGTVQYYAGAWRDFGNTTGGVANKELLPNNYSFRMTYEYVSLDKTQDLSTNSTVSFSTVLCMIRVKNSQSQPLDGATASYYSGAWRQIGTTVNGEVTKELLPVNLTFRVNYGTQQQDKTQNLSIGNVVDFSIQP